MDKKEIGRKISATRKELGMTQKDLAEKLHVTDKSVSKWETGAHFPDIAIMENLAAALRISVDDPDRNHLHVKGVGRQWFVWFAPNVYHRNVRLYRRIDFKRHRFHI